MSQYPYQSQPSWIDGTTAESQIRERAFFASVYRWMFGGLLLTALASAWVVFSPAMQRLVLGNGIVMIGLIIVEFGVAMYAMAAVNRISAATAASLFLVYSLLTGLTLSVVIFVYTTASVVQAFGTTAALYLVMSVYAHTTKRDLTRWGSFLGMGLIGIIIAMLVGFFFHSTALQMAISTIAVVIFTGLTAYYTQQLRRYAHAGSQSETFAIYGALILYINFINLFVHLLRLFGNRRN